MCETSLFCRRKYFWTEFCLRTLKKVTVKKIIFMWHSFLSCVKLLKKKKTFLLKKRNSGEKWKNSQQIELKVGEKLSSSFLFLRWKKIYVRKNKRSSAKEKQLHHPTAEWCHVGISDQTTCRLKEIKSINNKKGKTGVKPHLTCTNRRSLEPERRILNQLHSARRFSSFEDVPPLITAFMPPCWLKCEFIVQVYYVLLPLLAVISFYTRLDIINFIEPTRQTCLIYSFYSNFI